MTVAQQQHHHRSSSTLKQQNKPFKGDSKNKNARTNGKMEKIVTSSTVGSLGSQGKADRRNRAKMVQKAKRDAILSQKRMFQGSNCIPKNIVSRILN